MWWSDQNNSNWTIRQWTALFPLRLHWIMERFSTKGAWLCGNYDWTLRNNIKQHYTQPHIIQAAAQETQGFVGVSFSQWKWTDCVIVTASWWPRSCGWEEVLLWTLMSTLMHACLSMHVLLGKSLHLKPSIKRRFNLSICMTCLLRGRSQTTCSCVSKARRRQFH